MDGQGKFYCTICHSSHHPTEGHPQEENASESENNKEFPIEYWPFTKEEEDLVKRWEARHKEEWAKDRKPEPRLMEFLDNNQNAIGPKVLDIGSGFGRHLVPLAQRGYDVTGLDISMTGLRRTQEKLREEKITKSNCSIRLIRGGFRHLYFDNDSFDTAVSTLVLHNNTWKQAQGTFREIARVLKPGAKFFFMVRSDTNTHPENMKELEQGPQGMTWMREDDAGGVDSIMHDFTLEGIKMLAEQNGFEIVGEPVDERYDKDNNPGPGQWCVTFRKKKDPRYGEFDINQAFNYLTHQELFKKYSLARARLLEIRYPTAEFAPKDPLENQDTTPEAETSPVGSNIKITESTLALYLDVLEQEITRRLFGPEKKESKKEILFRRIVEAFRQAEAVFDIEGRDAAKPLLNRVYELLIEANNPETRDLSVWDPHAKLSKDEFDYLNLRRKKLSNAIGIKTASGAIRHDLNKI
jgi:SAM-dependent methyltransferase